MAWDNPEELVVAGTGEAYVAPVGTPLPANENSALNAAFVGLGYHDEDGVTINVDPSIQEFRGWQSRQPIRRELTEQNCSAAFKLQQWNEENIVLAFGGGEVTEPSSGHYKYTPPAAADALDERVLIVDVVDGAVKFRFVFYRGNVTEAVSSDFKRSATAMLPLTFKVLAPEDDPNGPPFEILTNSPAFAVGS